MHTYILYSLLKAPPQLCMEIQHDGCTDKYSTRQSHVLFLSQDIPQMLLSLYAQAQVVFNPLICKHQLTGVKTVWLIITTTRKLALYACLYI